MIAKHNPYRATLGLTRYAVIAALRNRTGLFFSIVFPLIFLSIFSALGNSSHQVVLGITPDVSKGSALYSALLGAAQSKDAPVKLVEGTATDLETRLTQQKVDGVLEGSPAMDITTLATSNNNIQGAASAQRFVNALASQTNLKAAIASNPRFVPPVSVNTREISGKAFNYIDFALPGQIGFALLSLATFGVAFPFITLRKTLVLKRMFATSIRPLEFIVSQCLSRSVQALITSAVIIFAGVFFFHFHLIDGWQTALSMFVLSVVGVLSFMGFGIFIAGIVKDEQTAPIVLNLFNLPQFLLAGVFFSTDGFPQWLQFIGNNLPLAYLNIAMRKVTSEGLSLFQVWPYVFGLVAWSVVAYAAAASTFKSEP
jgi:ABC-2 type transport system permease protein